MPVAQSIDLEFAPRVVADVGAVYRYVRRFESIDSFLWNRLGLKHVEKVKPTCFDVKPLYLWAIGLC